MTGKHHLVTEKTPASIAAGGLGMRNIAGIRAPSPLDAGGCLSLALGSEGFSSQTSSHEPSAGLSKQVTRKV